MHDPVPGRTIPRFSQALTIALAIPLWLGGVATARAGGTAVKHQPAIPGFERFFTGADADMVEGGRLLLAEMNCTSCHKASAAQQSFLLPRQAPILTDVGQRVKHGYIKKFLGNPHAVKPSTVMPDLFAGMPAAEKEQKIEALTHLLASTGKVAEELLSPKLIAKGQKLYHEVGCVACHGSRDLKGGPATVLPTSVPLVGLKDKYSLPSLTAFLESPHQSRPSGRMPGIVTGTEAREVAGFLLQGIPGPPLNVAFSYYEGNWDKLPDFKKLKPQLKGEASGFDLTLAGRPNDFGLLFEGYLKIATEGEYTFWLNSDDGSRLWIDGMLVVDNDGVHAPKTVSGKATLKEGMHPLKVGFFQVGGGVELKVDMQGPNMKRQPVAPHVYLTPEGNPPSAVKPEVDDHFDIKPELVAQGKTVFAEMGCASCHQLKIGGQEIAPKLAAPVLAKLKTSGGCLSAKSAKGVPHFGLTPAQTQALAAGIKSLAKPPAQPLALAQSVQHTLTTFNCYACHTRDKIGGPEQELSKFFKTTQQEMGEEGRIPTSLDGIGAKMKKTYLQQVFANGAHDRPYMLTRMPKFGLDNVGHLVDAFAKADPLADVKVPNFEEPLTKVKSAARHMVGAKAFGCIKCHTFNGHKAEGVQGIDMVLMTQRVNHDWFVKYLIDPQKYRPGTRMPTSWPGGQTQLPDVLGGDTNRQIEAIWLYLSDGKKASLPVGTTSQYIELVPENSAIIYRNFITGCSSKGIAVGFPEHANLCFDATTMSLALIWQGAFIDAAKHWTDRGLGPQSPLGDNLVTLPSEVSFAFLEKEGDAWPTKSAKELGYKFKGYTTTADDRPTFLYSFEGVHVEDFPNAVDGKPNPIIKRTLTLSADEAPGKKLWYRAAVDSKIEKLEKAGYYSVEGKHKYKLQIESTTTPVIRQIGGKQELLVPVEFKDKKAKIVQEYVW